MNLEVGKAIELREITKTLSFRCICLFISLVFEMCSGYIQKGILSTKSLVLLLLRLHITRVIHVTYVSSFYELVSLTQHHVKITSKYPSPPGKANIQFLSSCWLIINLRNKLCFLYIIPCFLVEFVQHSIEVVEATN